MKMIRFMYCIAVYQKKELDVCISFSLSQKEPKTRRNYTWIKHLSTLKK